ncbi:MAG: hypothetical protein ACQEWE_21575, partial [Bacillota bacterium]
FIVGLIFTAGCTLFNNEINKLALIKRIALFSLIFIGFTVIAIVYYFHSTLASSITALAGFVISNPGLLLLLLVYLLVVILIYGIIKFVKLAKA